MLKTHHVTKAAPPTIIFLGDIDKIIPISVLEDFDREVLCHARRTPVALCPAAP